MPQKPDNTNNGEPLGNREAGIIAAGDIWDNCALPGYQYPYDPQTREFASGALFEFRRRQLLGQSGITGKIAAGAQNGAEQLTVEKEHGMVEVVQNADDLGASRVNFFIEQETDGKNTLHMCHNGSQVFVKHVLAMTYAFVSTKSEEADSTGRFGVGLKTLGRLGSRLNVHSGVYSFSVESQLTTEIEQVTELGGGFFDRSRGDTLLSLVLDDTVNCDELTKWFESQDNSLLLFLRNVTQVGMRAEGFEHELTVSHIGVVELTADILLKLIGSSDGDSDSEIRIYERVVQVPAGLGRSDKATGASTTIAVAVTPANNGRIYATLPTRVQTEMPFAMNADFDPNASRENLQDKHWNIWLLEEIGILVADVVVALFKTDPRLAWYLVPMDFEAKCSDAWLKGRLIEMQAATHALVSRDARLVINGIPYCLGDLCYTTEDVDGLLESGDAELVSSGHPLVPEEVRDAADFRTVLASFGSSEVGIEKSFGLFDLPATAGRSAAWCAKLVKLAIDTDRKELLEKHRCFVLDNGAGRTALMLSRQASEWLTLATPVAPLKRLGLVKQLTADYRGLPEWESLEGVLAQFYNFKHVICAAEYLEALATRPQAVYMTPEELGEVRRLLDESGSASLGHRLGRVIELDAVVGRGSKSRRRALACDCYLPKAIASEKNGAWAHAAEGVEGIVWASPMYKTSLRGSRAKDGHGTTEKGPLRFLMSLGCEIAPRLLPRPAIIAIDRSQLLQSQLSALPVKATRLNEDFLSPDLDLVMRAISKMRKRDFQERSVRLFTALNSAWDRLYSGRISAKAMWDEKRQVLHEPVPATWLARAMEVPWLLNSKRLPSCPPGLVIGTEVNRAIYGSNLEKIALGLGRENAGSGLPQALGMLVEPDVRELIAQIKRLKQLVPTEWPTSGRILMQALVDRCDRSRPAATRGAIDGVSFANLQWNFESFKLIYLQKTNEWAAPSEVLQGSDIFHGRRWFVVNTPRYRQLWKVLGIRSPNVSDCLSVIEEIGEQKELAQIDSSVLIRAYGLLESLIDANATDDELKTMARLPLWTGQRFYRRRPVFVADDPALAISLGSKLDIWQPPFDAIARPGLLAALKVQVLGSSVLRVVGVEAGSCPPTDVEDRYRRAVLLMKNKLICEDPACCHACNWALLENVTIVLADTLALQVDVPLGKGERYREVVPVTAYCETSDGLVHFYRDETFIGSDTGGGRLVAASFSAKYRMRIEALWFLMWSKAATTCVAETLELTKDEHDEEDTTLEDLAKSSVGQKKKRQKQGTPGGKNTPAASAAKVTPVVLELKSTTTLTTLSATAANQGKNGGGRQGDAGRGLKKEIKPRVGNSGGGGGQQKLKGYTVTELETAGFDILAHLFNGGADESCKAEVSDFRDQRGIGADMIVDIETLRKWVELKSFAADAPAAVSLTSNEFTRAREAGSGFFLAVVSGLAKGFETIVRLYRNPVNGLPWTPSGSTSFGGLLKMEHLECHIYHDDYENTADDTDSALAAG